MFEMFPLITPPPRAASTSNGNEPLLVTGEGDPSGEAPFPPIDRFETIDASHEIMLANFVLCNCLCALDSLTVLEVCTDNPELINGLAQHQIYQGTFVGGSIGCCIYMLGSRIEQCGQTSNNLNLRLAAMATGDACRATGKIVMTTPLAPIMGTAALGAKGTAALTTATMSWLAAAPLAILCCAGSTKLCVLFIQADGHRLRVPSTTRMLQYQSVFEEKNRRAATSASTLHAPVMQ
jgi:hypothetical protein